MNLCHHGLGFLKIAEFYEAGARNVLDKRFYGHPVSPFSLAQTLQQTL